MTQWDQDCMRWHGRLLTGQRAHWCPDWDFLPVDETTAEISACTCGELEHKNGCCELARINAEQAKEESR